MLQSYCPCNIYKLWLTNKEFEEYSAGYASLLTLPYQPWQHLCSRHPSLDGYKKADGIAKEGKQHSSRWSGREWVRMKERKGEEKKKASYQSSVVFCLWTLYKSPLKNSTAGIYRTQSQWRGVLLLVYSLSSGSCTQYPKEVECCASFMFSRYRNYRNYESYLSFYLSMLGREKGAWPLDSSHS